VIVRCPNCGQDMTIDVPDGSAYWSMPGGYTPTAYGVGLLQETHQQIPHGLPTRLPSPPVSLPNTPDGRIVVHVPPCPWGGV